jgi:hypothetical protein
LSLRNNELLKAGAIGQFSHSFIKNGNMTSTDYWESAFAGNVVSAASNVLTCTLGTYDSNALNLRQYITYGMSAGDKVYATFKYKVTSGTNISPFFSISLLEKVPHVGALAISYLYSSPFTDFDNWRTISIIKDCTFTNNEMYFYMAYVDSGTGTNVTINLKEIGFVNLTNTYGAGSEPDLATCQSEYDEIWLEVGISDPMTTIIRRNILTDSKIGIVSANQKELACLDVYDINGNRVYDFSKGDIIKVGDVVRIDRDNDGNSISYKQNGEPRYWRVVGRQVSKVGVPKIALSLREII